MDGLDKLALIAGLVAVGIIVGALLFFPMRWLIHRFGPAPKEPKSPPATKMHIVTAAVVVASLLVLFWFIEAGNKVAGLIFVAVMVVAHIAAAVILKRSKEAKEEGDVE